jgi:hypothetical protein
LSHSPACNPHTALRVVAKGAGAAFSLSQRREGAALSHSPACNPSYQYNRLSPRRPSHSRSAVHALHGPAAGWREPPPRPAFLLPDDRIPAYCAAGCTAGLRERGCVTRSLPPPRPTFRLPDHIILGLRERGCVMRAVLSRLITAAPRIVRRAARTVARRRCVTMPLPPPRPPPPPAQARSAGSRTGGRQARTARSAQHSPCGPCLSDAQ